MDKLPNELTNDILNRLPTTEAVLESKLVCEGWKTYLSVKRFGLLLGLTPTAGDDNFTRLFYREKIIEEDFKEILKDNSYGWNRLGDYKTTSHPIVGSCNGLICFYVSHHHIQYPNYIMNLTTGEHLHLPKISDPRPAPHIGWSPRNVIGGFGYCQRTGQYKVVRIHVDGDVEVHTLGDRMGWRNIRKIPYTFWDSGVYAHGCIFWIDQCQGNFHIVYFNLDTEAFHSYSPPPHQIPGRNSRLGSQAPTLGMVLFGSRLLFYYNYDGKCYCQDDPLFDFWEPISDKNIRGWAPGGEWNWNLKRSILLQGPGELFWSPYMTIAFGNNDDILFQSHGYLTRYDKHTRTLTKIAGIPWMINVRVIPHMPSAVSLKNFGGHSELCTRDVDATNTILR